MIQITRATFEELCDDLFVALEKPISDVIKMSGYTPQDIVQVQHICRVLHTWNHWLNAGGTFWSWHPDAQVEDSCAQGY